MTFLILLETLQTIKKQKTTAQLEVLRVKVAETHGADGIRLLHQTLVGLGLQHKGQDYPLEVLSYANSSRNTRFYNHYLYQQLLPLCQFAYLSEKNGLAEEHAYKLATLFSSEQDVLLYLMQL